MTCKTCNDTGVWRIKDHPHEYICQTCAERSAPMLYAGIGPRKTPDPVCAQMELIASMLAARGIRLRSGGAKPPVPRVPGTNSADLAFERGCDAVTGPKTIRTPSCGPVASDGVMPWMEHARQFHPAWDSCDDYAKGCHARNSAIILGDNLDLPVSMVVTWTNGGGEVGGTGQGLRVAKAHNIPVFNLWYPDHMTALMEWINQ